MRKMHMAHRNSNVARHTWHKAQRAYLARVCVCMQSTHAHTHAFVAYLLQITLNNKTKENKAYLFKVNSPPASSQAQVLFLWYLEKE